MELILTWRRISGNMVVRRYTMPGRYQAVGPEAEFQVFREGVRIPSIADDVATDLNTVFSRTSGLRR
jgi:hypothetical protein